jgi:hypothetical protein
MISKLVINRVSKLGIILIAVIPLYLISFDVIRAQENASHILIFGDWGFNDDGANQRRVANAMIEACGEINCNVALSVGDNFYPRGVAGTSDTQWKTKFEELYFPSDAVTIGATVRPVLGDKDKVGNAQAQVNYSKVSPNWDMPNLFYSFSIDEIDIMAVDTRDFDEAQAAWLEEILMNSTAKWKVVFGHDPIYSNFIGLNASPPYSTYENSRLVDPLLPILCEYADLYLAGSSHHAEILEAECGLTLVVQGGGGAALLDINLDGDRHIWGARTFGFTILSISETELEIKMHNDLNELLYTTTLSSND